MRTDLLKNNLACKSSNHSISYYQRLVNGSELQHVGTLTKIVSPSRVFLL